MQTFPIAETLDIIGFATENAIEGAQVKIMTRDFITSDDPLFQKYVRHICDLFLNPQKVLVDNVTRFAIVIHANRTVDLFLNDELSLVLEISPKRDVAAGELVTYDNVADLRRVKLQDIVLSPSDKVICCIKVGWKFALFFDLSRPSPFDTDRMEVALGDLYRHLSFEAVYEALASDALTKDMMQDGWFPFLEIIGVEFQILSEAYKNNHDIAGVTTRLIASFTVDRLEKMTTRWWRNPIIAEHQPIFEAGIKAFLAGDEAGHISAIKILGSEIEGILRRQHARDTGKAKWKLKPALDHTIELGRMKTGNRPSSLFLPDVFSRYLTNNIFQDFDLGAVSTSTDVPLNRHSVAHGAAGPSSYTSSRALQMILIVDQLSFYAI